MVAQGANTSCNKALLFPGVSAHHLCGAGSSQRHSLANFKPLEHCRAATSGGSSSPLNSPYIGACLQPAPKPLPPAAVACWAWQTRMQSHMKSNPPARWSLRLLLCPPWPDQASFRSQPLLLLLRTPGGSSSGKRKRSWDTRKRRSGKSERSPNDKVSWKPCCWHCRAGEGEPAETKHCLLLLYLP